MGPANFADVTPCVQIMQSADIVRAYPVYYLGVVGCLVLAGEAETVIVGGEEVLAGVKVKAFVLHCHIKLQKY